MVVADRICRHCIDCILRSPTARTRSVVLGAFVKLSPADIARWLQVGATAAAGLRHFSSTPASVAAVIIYPRAWCYPASRAFAGEPDIVGRATGPRQVPGGSGHLDWSLTLVTRDRFHPNADDLEIVGGVHSHFPALSLISRSRY
jgi:hypothetical protein